MKSSLKRCIAGLICTAVLAGMLPWTAAAESSGDETITILDETETIIEENETILDEIIENDTAELTLLSDDESKTFEYLSISKVNPLYEDIITVSDLISPAPPTLGSSTLASESDYYTSSEEAGAVVREGLKNRTQTISVGYCMTTFSNEALDEACSDILAAACAHTGEPTEGDYLLWQYAGYTANASASSQSGIYYVTLNMTITYYTTAAQEAELDTAIDTLLPAIAPDGASDYEIVKAAYDWICANVTYDYDTLYDDAYKLKFTAYAAMLNKTAVCQGYALLMYRLMLENDIDCRLIPGDGGGPHAWNIVKLGDFYYNVDATWDAGSEPENYSYFLLNMESFTGHTRYNNADYGYYDTEEFHAAYPMAEENYFSDEDGRAGGTLGEESSITWAITYGGTLTISGEGAIPDFGATDENGSWSISTADLPWGNYYSEIRGIVIEAGITSIGTGAFYGCTGLTSVRMDETVTSIGMAAFAGCASLEEISLPAQITTVDSYAFDGCTALSEILFCGNAPAFGGDAFANVTATAYYPADNTTWTADVMQDYGGTVKWEELDSYEISTVEDLYTFAELVNSGHVALDGVLLNDITVNEGVLDADGNLSSGYEDFRVWTPIGSNRKRYTGTFDGGEYTISGLYFNDAAIDCVGFFGYAGDGSLLKNVTVTDSYFSGNDLVGGIVGILGGGETRNCVNHSTVVGADASVGGIAGYHRGIVSNCENTGIICGSTNVGGIVGEQYDYPLSNCKNSGQVTGTEDVGGIVGWLSFNTGISHCFDHAAGTIAGSITNYSTISDCYYLADSETDEFDGTTAVTLEQCRSGEVAFLLGAKWGQTIGEEDFPVLGGAAVYATVEESPCTGYTNNENGIKEHSYADGTCIWCGETESVSSIGDIDGDGSVSEADALYLLRYTILPERYPIYDADADCNGDGEVNAKDAVYLLKHISDPGNYPLS